VLRLSYDPHSTLRLVWVCRLPKNGDLDRSVHQTAEITEILE
jgi:hypothetical protein